MSTGARLFLLAIAIVDDIIAIAIIAVFYSDELALGWLGAAVALAVVIWACAAGAGWLPTWCSAIALWIAVHESGVHATIAGVVVGLLLPGRGSASASSTRCTPTARS